MKLKNYFFILFLTYFSSISCVTTIKASREETLDEYFTFHSPRTDVRPLKSEDIPAAVKIEDEDTGTAFIADLIDKKRNSKDKKNIKLQETLLGGSSLDDFRKSAAAGLLYYGIFDKVEGTLIGLIVLEGFSPDQIGSDRTPVKNSLSTFTKFHKTVQGKGFGTEVKKALIEHFIQKKLIPPLEGDIENPVFKGFAATINFRNKASLKYNIVNCGHKVVSLRGREVRVEYPARDVTLHNQVYDYFVQYLTEPDKGKGKSKSKKKQNSKATKAQQTAEKTLREISFRNVFAIEDTTSFTQTLEEEKRFIVDCLALYPEFTSINKERSRSLLLTKQKRVILKQKILELEPDEDNTDEREKEFSKHLLKAKKLAENNFALRKSARTQTKGKPAKA
jgi:RimJ/RimL family protein N-acetyltransferase